MSSIDGSELSDREAVKGEGKTEKISQEAQTLNPKGKTMQRSDEIIEQFRKELDESFDKTREEINRVFNIIIFVSFSVAAICAIVLLLINFKPT